MSDYLVGFGCLVCGCVVWLAVREFSPAEIAALPAPVWVMQLGCVPFFSAGGILLLKGATAFRHFCAFGFFLSFALVFWWVALFAPADGFEGSSFAFLPDSFATLKARVLFGAAALLATGILIFASTSLLTNRRRKL
ncbi:MAG: hypothetical protein AAF514_08310 [Verrucomicrobiota bacterium]